MSKDPVKEFERINEGIGSTLKKISSSMKKAFAGNTVQTNLREPKGWDSSGRKNNTYSYDGSSLQQNVKNTLNAAKNNEERIAKCDLIGEKPNYNIEINGNLMKIYDLNDKIISITRDISKLNIPKEELMCYDVKKDKFGISWLFNGKFNASKIWGDSKNIFFAGTWNSGDFKGIFVEPSKFIGGQNLGTSYADYKNSISKNTIKQSQTTFPTNLQINSDIPGFELFANIDVLNQNYLNYFKKFDKDFKNGKFLKNMEFLKLLIKRGFIKGNNGDEKLSYIISGNVENEIPKGFEYILPYFSNFNRFILDNILKKDGTVDEYLKEQFIKRMKIYLFGNIPTPKKSTTAAAKSKVVNKTLKTKMAKSENLDVNKLKNSVLEYYNLKKK